MAHLRWHCSDSALQHSKHAKTGDTLAWVGANGNALEVLRAAASTDYYRADRSGQDQSEYGVVACHTQPLKTAGGVGDRAVLYSMRCERSPPPAQQLRATAASAATVSQFTTITT